MKEDEAKEKIKYYLEKKGYVIKSEVKVEGGIVVMDFFGYKDVNGVPEIRWIEVKGEDASFTEVLGDLAKLCLVTFFNGGHGLLVIPARHYNNLRERRGFINAGNMITVIKEESIEENKMDTFLL